MGESRDLKGQCIPHHPSVSFILCVHRDNPWLTEAIESVLAQDDTDFEFLIGANDCDELLWEKLLAFGAKDNRIRLLRTDIGQLAFNLNLLANTAHGEYLIRMDADDISLPHRLTSIRAALALEAVDVLGSSVLLIDAAGTTVGQMDFPESAEGIRKALPIRTVFCHPSVAIRRKFLFEMRGYLGGFASEDADLWLRAHRAGASMANLPNVLLKYRIHGQQTIMSSAGYAEVAAHWLRELLIAPSWLRFHGFVVALSKAMMSKGLPGIRRYQNNKNRDEQFRR